MTAAGGADPITVEARNVGLLNRRDLTDRSVNGFAVELLVESIEKSRVLEAIPEGVSFEFDHVHPPCKGVRITLTRGEPGHRVTSEPSDYEWALNLLENDLTNAALRADPRNQLLLAAIVLYCTSCLPAACWGNPEKVRAWLAAEPDPAA